ncbi:MAG: ParB/RepB/Spo0J family partition protein [Oscillospiraceae bacterium]|nr:ParB/RepB/Spo0J family partition protein [Oscillospiraceae bacterium]
MAQRSTKRGLGAGVDALFREQGEDERSISFVPISRVEPRQDQPRHSFDEDSLAELADSISRHGLIQPITVRRMDGGYYQIIAGERRWRASRLAGLTEVPVRVIEADDKKATELALVENLQREDLNPIEEARGYRALMDGYGLTQEEAAAAVGKSRPAVANALRLLGLTEPVLEMVERGELSAGHARALLTLPDAKTQLELANAVTEKHLSVRQTEALAAKLGKAVREQQPPKAENIVVNYTREVEKELEGVLGRKVRLADGKKGGKIELEYYGAGDREELINDLLLFGKMRHSKNNKSN